MAARTGIPVGTLRNWEERYGLLRPARTVGGTRLYAPADVERVKEIARRRAAGETLAAIAHAYLAPPRLIGPRTKRLPQPAEQEQQEARALVDLAAQLASEDIEDVLAQATAEVRRLTGCDMSWLALYEGDVVRYAAVHGNRQPWSPARPLRGKGIWSRMRNQKEPLTIDADSMNPLDPEEFPIATAEDLHALAAVPLWLDGQLAGTLVAAFREAHTFTPVETDRLERLAGVTAIAVRNARLLQAAEHASEFESQLRALMQALLSVDGDVWTRACEEVQKLFRVDGVWLTRLQPEGNALQGVAGSGVALPIASRRIERHPASTMWRAVERREPIINPDVLAGESPYRSLVSTRTLLVAPLVHGDRVLGTITVFDDEVGRFTVEEQRRILLVAGQVALSMARAELVADLRHRESEATLLFQLSERVGRLTSEEEIIAALAEGARHLCGADFAGIAGIDVKGGPLRWRGVRGAEPVPSHMVKLAGDPIYEDLAAMRPHVVADVAAVNRQNPGRLPYLEYEGAVAAILAPFPLPRNCFGELLVGYRSARALGDRDLQLARSIASLAAVALEKIMLLREARAGERRARGLYELGRALTFGLEPESMLERLCRQASAAFGATSAHIWLLDAQGMLSVAAQHGNPAELAAAVGRLRIPTDAVSLAAVAVRTGESQLVLDAETDPRVNRTLYELLRWRSLIGAPLLSQGKAIGALMLGHPEPERFSRDDLNSATTITAQAAVAYSHARVYAALQQTSLQNARLLKEARDNERRARALYDIARALTSSLEPKPLLEELCRQAARSFQATAAVIMLREPNGDLTVTAHHGYTGAQAETVSRVRIPAGVSSVATVALQAREAQVVVDALTDSRVSSQLREVFGTRSLLLAPLESQGNVTGVMALVHAEPGKFSLEDREVAATLASQAAAAISHAQLYAELQHRQRITAIEARIAKAAGATLHLDEVMAAVCREAVDALEVGRVSMWLADAPGWLRRVAEAGIPGPTTAPTRLAYDGTLDDPAGFGKGRLRKDRTEPLSMEALELARRYQVADSISIPLGAAGKFMGVLVVMDLQQPDRFSTRDVELAEAVGRHAQLALANALAYRRQEEALTRLDELNRTRTGFLATMRHELRTPLNSIIGFTELLQNELTGGLNPKQARYVANVREAGAQLLQLIEDILEFVAVQGSDDMVRETFDAGLLVTELSGTMAPRAKLRGLALDSETPETVVPIVGDRLRLNRALRHLLENAIKFTDAGGSVRITARVEDALVIQVVDSGIGIPLEDQERIFEPFVQGDSSKTRRYAGTGLGLAIARRIIELHGGSLTLQSAPGAGSTFTLRLPIATAESAGRVVA